MEILAGAKTDLQNIVLTISMLTMHHILVGQVEADEDEIKVKFVEFDLVSFRSLISEFKCM